MEHKYFLLKFFIMYFRFRSIDLYYEMPQPPTDRSIQYQIAHLISRDLMRYLTSLPRSTASVWLSKSAVG